MIRVDRSRLDFLRRVVQRESTHLQATDRRLFATLFSPARVEAMANDEELAERVEAFVGRFGRLQDTVGDKLLPAFLLSQGERLSTVADNLIRAERLGLLSSAEQWLDIRRLRNQMVHEYVEDPAVLASALNTAHDFVPVLLDLATRLRRP